ncbi:hypothetical protein PVK06_047641 [Gossypium arboreum]|uniref:Uncharacterized protein n=1 Tax=Gossypium arboreum TaxID=29729 RepID=A0ABR0MFS0_GOSAR|nr:hypothetical protein PVK06_047641 [Gossypium arboreum]
MMRTPRSHQAVTGGPFDAHRVNFDTLCDVDKGVLGFDVCFPLGAAWDLFVSTWKNSQDFYLDEDPVENDNGTPSVENDNVAPPAKNDNAGKDVDKGQGETNIP